MYLVNILETLSDGTILTKPTTPAIDINMEWQGRQEEMATIKGSL